MSDPQQSYWGEAGPIQIAKHELLKHYANAWFPILARYAEKRGASTGERPRIIYVDCHAGRGVHSDGTPGSPLIVLRALLEHSALERITAAADVCCMFLEDKPDNFESLRSEIAGLGQLPEGLVVKAKNEGFEAALERLTEMESARAGGPWPALVVVDPFGYSLSMELLRSVLKNRSWELLITFMFQFINRATGEPSKAATLDRLYGTRAWTRWSATQDQDLKQKQAVQMFVEQLGCKHSNTLRMVGRTGGTKYYLVHATNHDRGRDVMKEAMWRVTPDGSFSVHQSTDLDQMSLVQLDADIAALKRDLRKRFAGQTIAYPVLLDWCGNSHWLPKHMHDTLRQLVRTGEALTPTGKFVVKEAPDVTFRE